MYFVKKILVNKLYLCIRFFFYPHEKSLVDNPSLLILVVLGLLAFSVMFVCRKGLNAAKARLSQGRRPLRRRKREDGGQ